MAKIGYGRSSAQDQDTSIQVARLKEAGCEIIRTEKASGKTREGRDELATIMEFVTAGDEVCVLRLDRLARSTRDVLNLVHELEQKGAALTVLEPSFSTKDSTGHLLVVCLGMVSQMERSFLRDRQSSGIAAAKLRGVYKGRKPTVPRDRIRELASSGMGPSAIATTTGVSRMSVHRALKESVECVAA